ncbi:MAG: UDP-N-acetylmuramoyl-L-alanine--D-glutamate ligase [Nitrospirae bacterium]|nr:UDP-N-acetylmuramoyl-L-alanine--D-glutamate ligase [Nitrospirota bacterium]
MKLILKNKKVLVVGLARSGVSAVRLLKREGAQVTVTDSADMDKLADALSMLDDKDIRLELGGHNINTFLNSDLIVISPGIPYRSEHLLKAKDKGIPVISEIELAYNFLKSPVIGITGTNGKSTVTMLTGELLKAYKKNVFIGGNLGTALTDAALANKKWEQVVAEISSFQLEAIKDFRPKIAVLMNITPDHLDRYDSMEEYVWAKKRIFENQGREDFAILNADDSYTPEIVKDIKSEIVLFSRLRRVDRGVYEKQGEIVTNISGKDEVVIKTDDLKIKGVHNVENAMAAIAASQLAGCPFLLMRPALKGFSGLEHRLELVRAIDGVKYINDSKGTNVGAVVKSLAGFTEPVILIAGGLDKGSDFTPLREFVKDKVRLLILIGKAKEKIADSLGDLTDTIFASSLEDAVNIASHKAEKGDVVLLSPACASFDMFKNFEDRGRVFKEAVEKIRQKAKGERLKASTLCL